MSDVAFVETDHSVTTRTCAPRAAYTVPSVIERSRLPQWLWLSASVTRICATGSDDVIVRSRDRRGRPDAVSLTDAAAAAAAADDDDDDGETTLKLDNAVVYFTKKHNDKYLML